MIMFWWKYEKLMMMVRKKQWNYLHKLPLRKVPRRSPFIHYLTCLKAPRVTFLPEDHHQWEYILLRPWYYVARQILHSKKRSYSYLGNQDGSLLSTESVESILSSAGILPKLSNSSEAELKLHAKMVEGKRKKRKNTSWKKHPILPLLLFRLCCYLLLVRWINSGSSPHQSEIWNSRISQKGRSLVCCTILVPVQPCSDYWF